MSADEEALVEALRRRDRAEEARVRNELGRAARERADLDTARKQHEEALLLFRELGQAAGEADSLAQLAALARQEGDLEAAQALGAAAADLRRERGLEPAGDGATCPEGPTPGQSPPAAAPAS